MILLCWYLLVIVEARLQELEDSCSGMGIDEGGVAAGQVPFETCHVDMTQVM